MAKHLSPTNVATYYHNQCQLYVHNAFHRPHQIGGTSKVPSPLAAAQFQRGLDFEARLFRRLEVADELIRLDATSEPKTALQIRDLILETGRGLDVDKAKYIANLAFQSPSFERELVQQGHGRNAVAFGVAKPDLIKITHPSKEKIVWEVIDAKSSSGLKSSHNAQIGFYHICLETLLASVQSKREGSPQLEPSEKASIWLPNAEDEDELSMPVSTPISLLLPPLRTFLFKTLPKILKLPRDQVEWHLNPSCQGCEFIDRCKDSTVKDGRLGMIPNLSLSDVTLIRDFMGTATNQGLTHSPVRLTEIEELDSLIKSSGMEKLERTYAPTAKRFQRLLGVQRTSEKRWSPLLNAARSHEPQLTRQRVFTFPQAEDAALYISVIVDVTHNKIGAFCISIRRPDQPPGTGLNNITGFSGDFVLNVAKVLRKILEHSPSPRTQVYTYSPTERSVIMSHLIQAALSTDPEDDSNDDIRLCLGALCEGAALLVTSFQPSILSGVLLSFLSKKNTLSKKSLQICCERLKLSHEGTVEVLRKRIETEQKRLAEMGGRAGDELHKREVGQLGKIVVLKREIERLVSLPIPGFVDLPQTALVLLSGRLKCKSDDVIFGEWAKQRKAATKPVWEEGLKDRNRCMRALVDNLRQRIEKAGLTRQVLLNEAKPLEVGMMDICRSPKLRKLMFMLQIEVVVRLQALWQDRLDGCPKALLRYVGAKKKGTAWYNVFDIVSGTIEPPVEDRAFYDWLLVAEPEISFDQMKVPPEIYFDDLSLCGLFFPLTRYTKFKWDEQPKIVKDEVFIANIADMELGISDSESKKPRSQAIMQTFYTEKQLQKDSLYRVSPRLVDFNLNRVLQNLVTMDFQETVSEDDDDVPFIELITNPRNFADAPSFCGALEDRREKEIVRGLNELVKLGNTHAKALVLKPSQQRAAKRMMLKRLSVIWGPPGTGKTYTLALSTLRMIEALGPRASKLCPIILVTAMTHAAIDAIFGKINSLMGHYRALKERDSSWLDAISLQRVFSGATHSAPTGNKVHIYAGTTYQLYKFCEKAKLMANLIIIDEAGQLALGTAALVIRWMSPHPGSSGLILAGDKEQLAPILGTVYPDSGEDLPLFGSVLDLLMGRKHSGLKVAETLPSPQSQLEELNYDGAIVQLLENFRLNQDLGAFVELIYAKKFKPQKSQDTDVAESLQLWLDTESSEDPIMQQSRLFLLNLATAMSRKTHRTSILTPPRIGSGVTPTEDILPASLALIRVRASKSSSLAPYEAHVKAEAKLAAALVHWLRESFGAGDNIFVACPHRIQRSAVRQAILSPGEDWGAGQVEEAGPESDVDALAAELAAFHVSEQGLRIDTVERLQGSEASFVIFLLSHTHKPTLSNHLEFLLSRRRLNVGISRAKSLCIVVSSRGVLQPSLEVLAKEDTRQGLEFLRAYEDRAWIGDIELVV